MALTYQYMKQRFNMGKQCMFAEQGPEVIDSIPTNPGEFKHYILRNPVHQIVQNCPIFSECQINTIRAECTSSGANHSEGGWPKDVNLNDIETTQRYRRKVEKEDGYIHCVMNSWTGLEHYILQNNCIDLYQTYFQEMPPLPNIEKMSCRTVNIYRDPATGPKRPITSISWQPEQGSRFVVSYVDVGFNRIPRGSQTCYIWDMENPAIPELALEPPCPALDLQFNARDGNIIAGALMSGQISYWDRRKGSQPVAFTPPHSAHRDVVKNIRFINAKSGTELFSGGTDGAVKWWDLRKFDEPTEEFIMDPANNTFDVPSMGKALGVSVLEFEPTMPTRFMTGTENGMVLIANRKGKTQLEKIPARYETHIGPVYALERNPAFLKNFVTVGDWTVRIWSEECKESCVIWSPPMRHKVSYATWSPQRLSLLLVSQMNGVLSLWDIMRKQYEPLLTMQVCEDPLLKLNFHENATFVACGSQNGNIYMVELSQSLAQSDKNDKVLMTQIFERESKRERILEARMREIRLKLRQEAEPQEATGGGSASNLLDPSIGDADLYTATSEFFAVVKKELSMM